MVPLGPAESFDAFRALADRRGRPGDRLIEALGEARVGTADSPEVWAPAVGAGIGLPAAAALGPAGYYADLAAPHGRRHVRVCTATACFAAQTGRHLTDVEHELGITAGTASPDGKTSLQVVRCLGYCYAGPAALDGDTPCTGPTLAGQFAGREPSRAPEVPAADDTGDPVLLGGVVAGEPAWRTWPRAVTAGTPDEVQREVAASALRGRGGAGFRVAAKWESAGRAPGTVVGRAADTVVAPGAGGPWAESDCVACGGCVDTCPTGAITEPGPGRGLTSGVRPAASRTRTTCGYCGVGCALDVATRDGRVTAVLPVRDGPVNKGHACVKGRFAHGYLTSPERLTRPLLRRDGHLEPVGRDEALGHVARGLRAAVDAGGADAVAAISSARATNEENYLVQKFMRVVIGTNDVWVIGEDVCATDPDANRVVRALDACPLVVCNELFLSETARHADVVLPVASWLEKDGTFVKFDRRFQRVRPAVPPPGEARSDFDTVQALAAAMGVDLGCAAPADALAECGRVAPVFAGLSHDRLDREGAVPWPCPDPGRPGEATLHRERFATPDGRAHLAAAPYLQPGEQPDDDYPLILVTGRRWAHYDSGSMTRRGGNLALDPVDFLDLHPDDAVRYDVRDGTQVAVESRHGPARLIARVSEQTSPGQLFSSFHFPASGVNRLTSDRADIVTSCPEYKVTAVRVASH